jgi:hypothetical protein
MLYPLLLIQPRRYPFRTGGIDRLTDVDPRHDPRGGVDPWSHHPPNVKGKHNDPQYQHGPCRDGNSLPFPFLHKKDAVFKK